jgi:hypothetical protein
MTHCRNRVAVHVVFFQPHCVAADWARTDLWDSAASIPGVAPRLDLDGTEHEEFDARVSGEVFLYLPGGRLVFHGGITASRGHAGDNGGRLALESFLDRHNLPLASTPVFGCELRSTGLDSQHRTDPSKAQSDQ